MPVAVITQNTTVQNGSFDDQYTGLLSNQINANDPTTSNQNGRSRVYEYSTYSRRQFYQATGLSNITGPVTVNSATMYFYIYAQATTADVTMTLRRVLQAIVDGEITWNVYSTGNAWDTGGGSTAGTDIDTSAAASGLTGIAAGAWFSVTGANLAAMVEGWINGTYSNYGLQMVSSSTDYKDIVTGAGGYDGTRPELFVDWSVSGGGGSHKLTLLGVG